jgi:hypothetical protein
LALIQKDQKVRRAGSKLIQKQQKLARAAPRAAKERLDHLFVRCRAGGSAALHDHFLRLDTHNRKDRDDDERRAKARRHESVGKTKDASADCGVCKVQRRFQARAASGRCAVRSRLAGPDRAVRALADKPASAR